MLLIAGVFVLNRVFGWSDYLKDMNNLAFLEQIIHENMAVALLVYIAVTIIGCVVLALPGITFAIIAGMFFGPILGTLACSLATTLGAIIAFVVGRFFLKDSIGPIISKNKYLKKFLFDEAENNEIFVLMITRLVPIFPYNLQNFAYGVTEIRLATYSLYSFIFMIPGTAMYTIGAAGIVDKENRWLLLAIAVGLAVIVILAGRFLNKKYVGEEDKNE